jgi:hypothetical protein
VEILEKNLIRNKKGQIPFWSLTMYTICDKFNYRDYLGQGKGS